MDENIKKMIEERQQSNLKILDLIMEYVDKYPQLRFGQILANLNIIQYDDADQKHPVIDPFYEESTEMYNRIMNKQQ